MLPFVALKIVTLWCLPCERKGCFGFLAPASPRLPFLILSTRTAIVPQLSPLLSYSCGSLLAIFMLFKLTHVTSYDVISFLIQPFLFPGVNNYLCLLVSLYLLVIWSQTLVRTPCRETLGICHVQVFLGGFSQLQPSCFSSAQVILLPNCCPVVYSFVLVQCILQSFPNKEPLAVKTFWRSCMSEKVFILSSNLIGLVYNSRLEIPSP